MKSGRKIFFIIALIVIFVLLWQFGVLDSVIDSLNGFNSAGATETTQHTAVVQTSAQEQTQQTTQVEISNSDMPALPEQDYSGLDLFKDGFAVARYIDGIDGDTAIFRIGGEDYHARFLAIDTPEVDPELRQVEPWGKAASAFTKSCLNGAGEIVLELDPDSDVFDRYDRVLVWVWVDGELLNYRLVEEGLAEVAYLYGDYRYTDKLFSAQDAAQKSAKKIWGERDPDFEY